MTIKEIAEKAKVSVGTVDRVLHNRGEVSEKTREKVLQIMREGNYEPNLFARQLVLNKVFTIVSLLPSSERDDYWAYPEQGVRRSEKEVKPFGIQNQFFFFEEENEQDFERVAREAIKVKPDGLLLAPVIHEKARWVAEQCAQEQIPLVLIDSDLPDSKRLVAIGQHAYQSGRLAGKLLHFTGARQSVYLVNITRRNENNPIFKQRKSGFYTYFQEQSLPLKIEEVNLKVEESNFRQQLEELSRVFREGDAVFAPDSKVHWLAAAVKAAGKSGQIHMVGYDLMEKNKQYLQDETIDFLINQKPELQGYLGMQSLYKFLVLKQQEQESIRIPIEIVTKENLAFIS